MQTESGDANERFWVANGKTIGGLATRFPQIGHTGKKSFAAEKESCSQVAENKFTLSQREIERF
jgi:hypothetical protein